MLNVEERLVILGQTVSSPSVAPLNLEVLTGAGSTLNLDGNRPAAAERSRLGTRDLAAEKLRRETDRELWGTTRPGVPRSRLPGRGSPWARRPTCLPAPRANAAPGKSPSSRARHSRSTSTCTRSSMSLAAAWWAGCSRRVHVFHSKVEMGPETDVFDLLVVELTAWRIAVEILRQDLKIAPQNV